jgi:sugar phosphate isomerase/epimerase
VARAHSFKYCLNTGTIRGQKLGLVNEIELAAKAGYQAIEPWVQSIQQYVEQGGSLSELKRRITDLGLTVESAIGFSTWIAEDADKRAQGLEQARRDMDLLAQIGAKRLAAPPAGATSDPILDLQDAADRYRALLEVGDGLGVVPTVEVWGFSKNLTRLSQAVYVAVECRHPRACVLADAYHLYKGGSDAFGLRLLSAEALPVFHMNDYPDMPRETIQDRDRVFPGDGVAPLGQILKDLHAINPAMVLSLELFNAEYWKRPALDVAREGLAKMKQAVQRAI